MSYLGILAVFDKMFENTHLGFLAEFDKMSLQLLDGKDEVWDHFVLLATFDLKQQNQVSLKVTRLPRRDSTCKSPPPSNQGV